MCEISRKIREDGEKEGISKGISKGKAKMRKEIVENMVKSGKFSYEDIVLATGIPMNEMLTLVNL